MRSLFLLLMLVLPASAFGETVQVRKNVFGGYNYIEKGKISVSTRPNVFGGYNYSGQVRGFTRPSVNGGFNFTPLPTQRNSRLPVYRSR